MTYSFSLKKYGGTTTLTFIDHRPVGENDWRQAIKLNDEELESLMRAIQSFLPMEVCESSDIKFLNGRLRKVEEQLVSVNIKYDKVRDALSDFVGRL